MRQSDNYRSYPRLVVLVAFLLACFGLSACEQPEELVYTDVEFGGLSEVNAVGLVFLDDGAWLLGAGSGQQHRLHLKKIALDETEHKSHVPMRSVHLPSEGVPAGFITSNALAAWVSDLKVWVVDFSATESTQNGDVLKSVDFAGIAHPEFDLLVSWVDDSRLLVQYYEERTAVPTVALVSVPRASILSRVSIPSRASLQPLVFLSESEFIFADRRGECRVRVAYSEEDIWLQPDYLSEDLLGDSSGRPIGMIGRHVLVQQDGGVVAGERRWRLPEAERKQWPSLVNESSTARGMVFSRDYSWLVHASEVHEIDAEIVDAGCLDDAVLVLVNRESRFQVAKITRK